MFFEPVSKLKYATGDQIYEGYKAQDGSIIPWMGGGYQKNFTTSYRQTMSAIIKKFIRIKPHIMSKVDSFYGTHMKGRKTIGIHIRRSDKKAEAVEVALDKFIQIIKIFPDYQYLIASDVKSVIQEFQRMFGKKVIAYDAYRSDDNSPVHYQSKQDKIKLGEDVLIETLLLSRCDFFIHGCSNVATAVLFFNPTLHHGYVSEETVK